MTDNHDAMSTKTMIACTREAAEILAKPIPAFYSPEWNKAKRNAERALVALAPLLAERLEQITA